MKCNIWTASSEFGSYRLCEQRRFRRACASAQSRQNLRCSLIQAVSQEEPSDRKPDPWPLWMTGHAQLKFVMTEFSKTQIRLTGLIWHRFWHCFDVTLHDCTAYNFASWHLSTYKMIQDTIKLKRDNVCASSLYIHTDLGYLYIGRLRKPADQTAHVRIWCESSLGAHAIFVSVGFAVSKYK